MSDSTPSISAISRFGIIFLVGGFVFVLGMWGFLNYLPAPKHPAAGDGRSGGVPSPGTVSPGSSPAGSAGSAAPDVGKARTDAATLAESVAQVSKTIEQAFAVLNDPNNKDKAQALQALKDALRAADPKAAISGIRQFLATGKDAATGQGFKVGEGGALDEAPTMRTFLMDQLGSLSSEQHTADAAAVAREILGSMQSPDEWALALRNIAWNDPVGSKAELAARARELITYSPWQQQPTAGYMQAFDAAAASGDPTLLEVLVPLSKTPSPLTQAALVAIDRLSAMAPDRMAGYLNSHPDVLADVPLMRADYMGKVDLSNSAQKSQAETYLQREDVTQPEKNKFLQRLGVPAEFVSDNLITPSSISPMPLLERRALANQVAAEWLNSGRFPTLQSSLQELIVDTQPEPNN